MSQYVYIDRGLNNTVDSSITSTHMFIGMFCYLFIFAEVRSIRSRTYKGLADYYYKVA